MKALGIGTKFRCVTVYHEGLYSKQKYTFLLHEPRVLVAEHYSHAYNILDDGSLLIWQRTSHIQDPMDMKGMIFSSSDPMVIDLNKALLEEAEANMLGLNPKE